MIFSVVYTLLLQPLPYPRPAELVNLGLVSSSAGENASLSGLPPTILKALCDDPHGEFCRVGRV